MDAVTYPNADVVAFIQDHVVPIRLPSDAKPEAGDFNVKWTPTLVILDTGGGEHHRTTGFLAPEQLIPMILLGIGKTHFEREQFPEAIAAMDRLLAGYSDSDAAPEAIFFRAVSRYKNTNDAQPLKQAYEELTTKYPSSEWARRAAPYRLL